MTSVHALPGLASKIFYFSHSGECIHFCLDVVVDHSSSVKVGCVKPLNYRQNALDASSSCNRAAADQLDKSRLNAISRQRCLKCFPAWRSPWLYEYSLRKKDR